MALDVGWMFMTSWVFSPVPSVRHSSRPVTPSLAVNSSWPLTTVIASGDELAVGMVLISRTRYVPASVPSLRQSSVPSALVVAAK